mgnify:FL=1
MQQTFFNLLLLRIQPTTFLYHIDLSSQEVSFLDYSKPNEIHKIVLLNSPEAFYSRKYKTQSTNIGTTHHLRETLK